MIRRQTLLQYIQRALIQRLGLGVLALEIVKRRQVSEAGRYIGMLFDPMLFDGTADRNWSRSRLRHPFVSLSNDRSSLTLRPFDRSTS